MNNHAVVRNCSLARWTAAAVLSSVALCAPAVAQTKVEKRFPVDVRPVIQVRNDNGKVTVRSWQKSEVQVIATLASAKVEMDAQKMGNRIDITSHRLEDNVTAAEQRVDYEITVPEETELQVRIDSGMILVERVFGDLVFDTVAADVELQEVAGYIVVKTISGSVLCVRCAGGRLEIFSVSGNVRLIQPVNSAVLVNTTTSNILFEGDFLRTGSYRLKNYSGLIEVVLNDSDSLDISANAVQGKIESDPGLKLTPRTHGGRPSAPARGAARSFVGMLNDGAARVDLSTFNGTIRIRRRE